MIIKILSLFILIFVCAIGLMSVNLPDKENTFNITNTVVHNSITNASQSFKIDPNATELKDVIINIVFKIIDTMIYVTEQIMRIAIKFAIDHPEINYRLILNLIFLALLLYIAIPLLKGAVIIFILVKDILTFRREKKELNRLRKLRNA